MDIQDIYDELCSYDRRNPQFKDLYPTEEDEQDAPPPRPKPCYCDNCFYGRDRLAVELLKLREQAKIWVLTEYQYDTYSYSGMSESRNYYFLSEESARRKAEKLGLTIREWPETPDHATLEEEEVRP